MNMNSFSGAVRLLRASSWLLLVATLSVTFSTLAGATTFKLTYEGVFNSQDALNLASAQTPTYLPDNTPFTAIAIFSDTSTNLAALVGVPGFVAYSPIMATITTGGQTYKVASYDENPTNGITVAVFDNTTPFGPPGHYAIGYLQNPVQDGAGFIGDFLGASPGFKANALTSTVFTGYYGVGYGSGVCLQGSPESCSLNAITPLVLYDNANTEWALTLGNYDEDYIPGPLNMARLEAIPEPGTLNLVGAGLVAALLGVCRAYRLTI